jgi:SagB-type dehydrogenase family enzyme
MTQVIPLPPAPSDAGVDLVAALRLRRSTREFDGSRALTHDIVSALLWAANGVNDAEGKRTAPSAFGGNQVKIYLATAGGAFRYEAVEHGLVLVCSDDIRVGLCPDEWTGTSAGSIILTGRMDGFPDFVTPSFATELLQATAGCIGENVHLMAAALGLGTCMVGHMNADRVREALDLEAAEVPLYVMPVGYFRG